MITRAPSVIAAAISVAAGVPAADGAPTGRLVAQVSRPTPVTGYAGYLAFSTWDGKAFRLTIWNRDTGQLSEPPVPARSVPFDADLGPSASDGVSAVYSRCSVEPYYDTEFASDRWSYTQGRGCDVYRFDIGGGRERRVSGAASRRFSEVLPTIWRDRVAFARVPRGWTGRSVPQLRVVQGATTRAVRGGSADFRDGPTKLDSYGTRLVFEWSTSPYRCTGPNQQSGSNEGNELWMVTTGRSIRRKRTSRYCAQDRTPGVLTTRPSVGPRGIVASSSAAGESRVVRASLARPGVFRSLSSSACIVDVSQFDGGVAVVDQTADACRAGSSDYVIRALSSP